jgi:hypothetical protein
MILTLYCDVGCDRGEKRRMLELRIASGLKRMGFEHHFVLCRSITQSRSVSVVRKIRQSVGWLTRESFHQPKMDRRSDRITLAHS